MKKNIACWIFSLFITAMTGVVHAGPIIQASSVWTDGDYASYPIENIIDQSGLSANYVSGVNDFDEYVSTTTASYQAGASEILGSNAGGLTDFYFDLGAVFSIDGLAIWNQWGSAALLSFDIYASADDSFDSRTFLGSYSIANGPATVPGYSFLFEDTLTQFISIDVTANAGAPFTQINEVAFRQSHAASIPEPAFIILLGIGIACLALIRRKGARATS